MFNLKSIMKHVIPVALSTILIILLLSSSSVVFARSKSYNNVYSYKKHGPTTITPTVTPKITPTITPKITPTVTPKITPTVTPTVTPKITPTITPTVTPTIAPTDIPIDPSLSGFNKAVYVKNFGAYGDGIHDDTKAINQALNSGADAVVFEANASYKANDYISMDTPGVTVIGNNATLFTDNDYRSRTNFYEWFFNVVASNITINELNLEAKESILVGYKTQFVIMNASNVTVNKCDFTIPSTVLSGGASHAIEYSNLDLFTGWHNIIIQNSTFTNLADTNAGVCAEFRDIYNKGASGLSFTNNTSTSNCHDEIIAMFTGSTTTLSDISVTNNYINAIAGNVSIPRTLGISLGYDGFGLSNITFSGNTVNIFASYAGIAVGDSDNVTVSDNTINFTALTNTDRASVFKGSTVDNNINVTNNTITIASNTTGNFGGISDGYINFTSNEITCNSVVTDALFSNNSVVKGNTIIVNSEASRLGNSLITFEGNNVTFNSTISTMFEFYNKTLTSDVNINNNTIVCRKDSPSNSTIFMLNGTTINGNVFSFSNNKVTTPNSSTAKSFYYMAITDTTTQKIVLTNNLLSNYSNTYVEGGITPIYNIIYA
jgi:sRNA-binding regulator protein Hfq